MAGFSQRGNRPGQPAGPNPRYLEHDGTALRLYPNQPEFPQLQQPRAGDVVFDHVRVIQAPSAAMPVQELDRVIEFREDSGSELQKNNMSGYTLRDTNDIESLGIRCRKFPR